jgi:putative heme iron utilization protein
MTGATPLSAITPRGLELGGSAPADFDPVAMARQVLRTARTAALATLDPKSGFPLATLTNIATDSDGSPLFFASELSLHTRNIEADPRLSLLVTSWGKGDPLANSARLSVVGRAQRCDDANARRRFLARHPKAKLYADFPDFALYRVEVLGLHPNGGFARAGEIAPRDVLLDLTGCEALVAAEAEALEHLNADHPDTLALYATRLLGLRGGRWKAIGLDPEGLDLVNGDEAARLPFPERAWEPSALRRVLAALADEARSRPAG